MIVCPATAVPLPHPTEVNTVRDLMDATDEDCNEFTLRTLTDAWYGMHGPAERACLIHPEETVLDLSTEEGWRWWAERLRDAGWFICTQCWAWYGGRPLTTRDAYDMHIEAHNQHPEWDTEMFDIGANDDVDEDDADDDWEEEPDDFDPGDMPEEIVGPDGQVTLRWNWNTGRYDRVRPPARTLHGAFNNG